MAFPNVCQAKTFLFTRNAKITSLSARTGSTLDGIYKKDEIFFTFFFELSKLVK